MFNCEIMKIAQDYSEHLANDVKTLVHSKNTFHGEWMGENLASAYGQSISGELPTNMWYNEVKKYDFNNPGFSMETGHFRLHSKTRPRVASARPGLGLWPIKKV